MAKERENVTIPHRQLVSISLTAVCVVVASCASLEDVNPRHSAAAAVLVEVPGTVLTLQMMPVSHEGEEFWISSTEITWDLYDLFVYGDDFQPAGDADAVTRPTQPYIAMDRGFGRNGYPAMSMSFQGAQQFCLWLSQRTGKSYRLPKVAEWRAACLMNDGFQLDEHAWHAGNADRSTHPVATKQPNALGLHDMLGNVAEWCVDEHGNGVVMGGSFRDEPHLVTCSRRQTPSPAWNASDPQFPPSEWWLADAPFVGFRVVLEKTNQNVPRPQNAKE